MRAKVLGSSLLCSLLLTGCAKKIAEPGPYPIDPYEKFNRKVYRFNKVLDTVLLKPVSSLYVTIIPGVVRKGVNNAFNNLDMVPTVINDILQAKFQWAIKDSWRFVINSTLGVAGVFDVAQLMSLPPHYNDLGLTLAHWGDRKSPYLVLPLLGPSTLRDGYGLLFQFSLWSPYVYVDNDALAYGLAGLRLIDLRAQMLDSERLLNEALDQYSFIRDAYLQNRNYLINGGEFSENQKIDTEEASSAETVNTTDYVDE